MRDELAALENLQGLDTRAYEIQQKRDAIPAKIQELKGHLEALREILNRERSELEEAERGRREHEAELNASLTMIKASKTKLKAVKNTKEYHAISKELEAQKRINGEKEDEILRLMDVIQQGSDSMRAHEEEFNKLLAVVQKEEAEGRVKLQEFDRELGGFTAEREQFLGAIRKNVLRRYDMVRAKKAGVAVVRVVDGGCEGCNIQLPPQLFNIIMRQTSIEACPSCYRILLYRPSPEPGGEPAEA